MGRVRLPEWVINRQGDSAGTHRMRQMLRGRRLHTVCESALCPNLGECFSKKTATFMILGNSCTRSCAFCAVRHEAPQAPDPGEPERIAAAVREISLRHVVITSVTRDDLADGGSGQFVEVIERVRAENPDVTIEVLTPDFKGDEAAIRCVAEAGPDVFNHNLETVPRLYHRVRSAADYRRSLELLFMVKRHRQGMLTKSGIMVGLGETREEVIEVMRDLRHAGCDLLTVGQYLRPRKVNLPVAEYVSPEIFSEYERNGKDLGFVHVLSGPLVRSSFHAAEMASTVLSP